MNWVLLVVSLLSLISLILSIASLIEKPKNEEYVIMHIIGMSVLFLSMSLKRMYEQIYDDLLNWSSILGSGLALGAISVAYGANINSVAQYM